MFTIPLVLKALALLGLGIALAIPCFVRTCGDPVLRLHANTENMKLYWAGLAAGLLLVASGLVVSVSAASEMATYKPPAEQSAAEPANYSGG